MQIFYRTTKLRKEISDAQKRLKAFGLDNARKIDQRLKEIEASENLAELLTVGSARAHLLKGPLADFYALDLVHPSRMLIRPVDPTTEDTCPKPYDAISIIAVSIDKIETDYH